MNAIEEIAKVCHEANRAYCESTGDFSQVAWENAPEWQKLSAIKGVEFALNGNLDPIAQHDSWSKEKLIDGWVYGPVKDAEKKTHPCLVPYHQLPLAQQKKDLLFVAIVNALRV